MDIEEIGSLKEDLAEAEEYLKEREDDVTAAELEWNFAKNEVNEIKAKLKGKL